MTSLTAREREIAQRLLVREVTMRGSTDPHTLALGVLSTLNDRFVDWFGHDGTRTMLARALDRARALEPGLEGVRVITEAKGVDLRFEQTNRVAEALDRQEVAVVLASILSLTRRLIGQDLLDRMLTQAFPDLDLPSEIADENESGQSPDPHAATSPTNTQDNHKRDKDGNA